MSVKMFSLSALLSLMFFTPVANATADVSRLKFEISADRPESEGEGRNLVSQGVVTVNFMNISSHHPVVRMTREMVHAAARTEGPASMLESEDVVQAVAEGRALITNLPENRVAVTFFEQFETGTLVYLRHNQERDTFYLEVNHNNFLGMSEFDGIELPNIAVSAVTVPLQYSEDQGFTFADGSREYVVQGTGISLRLSWEF